MTLPADGNLAGTGGGDAGAAAGEGAIRIWAVHGLAPPGGRCDIPHEPFGAVSTTLRIERMAPVGNSVYKVIEIVGTSETSWEDATAAAVATASKTLRDLRVAEVVKQDVTINEDGTIDQYRTRLSVSFKYQED